MSAWWNIGSEGLLNIKFMRQELGYLVAKRVWGTWSRPNSGVVLGDSLTPAIYGMAMAIL